MRYRRGHRFRRRIRAAGEIWLARAAAAALPPLPRGAILVLAWTLGDLACRLAPRLRRVALANLDLAFGAALDPARKAGVVRESFRCFALVILDLFWFSRRTASRLNRYVEFDGSFDAYFDNRPAITVSAHFGNWEVLGMAIAERGHPSTSVAAPLKNPAVSRMLNRLRSRTGQRLVMRHGAARSLLAALRRGGRIALLLDQNTPPESGGAFVEFFGRQVPMSLAAERLAGRTGAAVVPVFCVPRRDGTYLAFARGPLRPETANGTGMTRRIAAVFEAVIRERPGCWLWTYKRWKHVPPGTDAGTYPFYASSRESRPGNRERQGEET